MSTSQPVRLAVFFDQTLHDGGGYQQALNAALLVIKLPAELVEPIFFTNNEKNIEVLRSFGINAKFLPLSFFRRGLLNVRRRILHVRILRLWKNLAGRNAFERHFAQYAVDLIYFLSPTAMANDLEELNYIATIWDLCHRDDPEFPEVRAGRVFEQREGLYRSILPKATALFVDSPLGKVRMMRRYGIDEERVHVMPFIPAIGTQISDDAYRAGYIDIRKKYRLDLPYVFYPAQFWAHKNHVYLLQGLKCLEVEFGEKVGAILAGGDHGNLAHVRQTAARLDLSDRVRFAGFVPDEEIKYLYKQSLALVMPTYFGPSNLPPLEAFNLGVPVLYSDKPGTRDQVGGAALLMDLQEPRSMAAHLASLIENPGLCETLVERGKAVLAQYSNEERLKVLTTVLRNFQRRRACWA
jgi:glycosyltransferase involved in cell wall biosynthesis